MTTESQIKTAAQILIPIASNLPHRQEYYSGGNEFHFCTSLGCEAPSVLLRGFSPEDAMAELEHTIGCTWTAANMWVQNYRSSK